MGVLTVVLFSPHFVGSTTANFDPQLLLSPVPASSTAIPPLPTRTATPTQTPLPPFQEYLIDSFADSDSLPLTSHAPDFSYNGSSWTTNGQSFTIQNGRAVALGSKPREIHTNLIDIGSPDIEMTGHITVNIAQIGSTYNGFILRYQDATHYLLLWIDKVEGDVKLEQVSDGVVTRLDQIWLALNGGEDIWLSVRMAGPEIRFSVQTPAGINLTHVVYTNFNLDATQQGLIGTTNASVPTSIDDLSIRSLTPLVYAEPSMWFNSEAMVTWAGNKPQDGEAVLSAIDLSNHGNLGAPSGSGRPVYYKSDLWAGQSGMFFSDPQYSELLFPANFNHLDGFTIALTYQLVTQTFPTGTHHHDLFRFTSQAGNNSDRIGLVFYDFDRRGHLFYMVNGVQILNEPTEIQEDGKWHILVWTFDFYEGKSIFRFDGQEAGVYTDLPPFSADGALGSLGCAVASYHTNMYVHEFRTYNASLDTDQMVQLENVMWLGEPIATSTFTPTSTETATPTKTLSPSVTASPMVTRTPTSTGTATLTPTRTGTALPTRTPTRAPTLTATKPPTPTRTATLNPNIPAAPTNLMAIAQYGSKVALSFFDNAMNETGFVVERSVNGSAFAILINLAARINVGTVTYNDIAVSAGNQYTYRVKALNGVITSAYSNTSTASIPPNAPSNLQLVTGSLTSTSMTITWNDNQGTPPETGYEVLISTNGTTFTIYGTAPTNVTSLNITGLLPDTNYNFRVRAFNAGPPRNYSTLSNNFFIQTLP